MDLTNDDIPRSLIIRSKKNSSERSNAARDQSILADVSAIRVLRSANGLRRPVPIAAYKKTVVLSFLFLLVFGLHILSADIQAQNKRVDVVARVERPTPPARSNSSSTHSRNESAFRKTIGWLPSKIKKVFVAIFSDDGGNEAAKGSRVLSLCELIDNLQTYHRQNISVRGTFQVRAEQAWFYDPACKDGRALTDVNFLEHVNGAARKLDRIIARNQSARVTFEGIFYGPQPFDTVDPDLPAPIREKLRRSPKRFETMIAVKRVIDPAEVPSVPAQVSSNQCLMEYANRNQVDPPPLLVTAASGRAIVEVGPLEKSPQEIGPVAGACLGLFTEATHQLVSVTAADSDGRFRFEGVPDGLYRLIVRADPLCVANIPLRITSSASQNRGNVVVHMRAAGLDECSYGDYSARGVPRRGDH